jgi:hypothetical protein
MKAANVRFAPRMKLVELGMHRPDLLDAHITSGLDLLIMGGWEFECYLYVDAWNVKGGCARRRIESQALEDICDSRPQ